MYDVPIALGDETGGPIQIETIDLEALARDRDQLCTEAVAAFCEREPWHLSGEAEENAREEKAERQEDEPRMAQVSGYVSDKSRVSCSAILGALGRLPYKMTRKDTMRVVGLLRRLGFARQGEHTSGGQKDLSRYGKI